MTYFLHPHPNSSLNFFVATVYIYIVIIPTYFANRLFASLNVTNGGHAVFASKFVINVIFSQALHLHICTKQNSALFPPKFFSTVPRVAALQLIPEQLIPIRYPKENGALYSVLFWITNGDQLLSSPSSSQLALCLFTLCWKNDSLKKVNWLKVRTQPNERRRSSSSSNAHIALEVTRNVNIIICGCCCLQSRTAASKPRAYFFSNWPLSKWPANAWKPSVVKVLPSIAAAAAVLMAPPK